jgi:hypothetical protein
VPSAPVVAWLRAAPVTAIVTPFSGFPLTSRTTTRVAAGRAGGRGRGFGAWAGGDWAGGVWVGG